MNTSRLSSIFALAGSVCLAAGAAANNWPQFRGPQASGVGETTALPTTWNVDTGENIRWQTSIPGLAHASPIIWQDRIYLATALKPGGKAELKVGLYGEGNSYSEKEPHQWRLLCLDKATGKVLWDKLGYEAVPRLERHTKATHCNSTPATDGKRIVAVFGSEGLFCFDTTGQQLWDKDLGKLHGGRMQIIVNGWKQIGGYDFSTGRALWSLREGGDMPVASPILAGDSVILTSGHGKYRPMRLVRLNATGDVTPPEIGATNQAVAWCHPRKGNYLQTPIVVGDPLWGCSNDGIVTCFDARSGKLHYEERIGGGGQGFTASAVAANGQLYFIGERGDVFVIPAAEKFSVLATNKLGGICLATPAISEGALLFRTTEKMLAVGSKK